jgi:cytochrome c oxidase subunit III
VTPSDLVALEQPSEPNRTEVESAMEHAPAAPTGADLARHVTPAATTAVQHPPVSPGKVAMWLFLATEVMFFTGLIGSYIVLRTGSQPASYSNLFSPATDLTRKLDAKGVRLLSAGPKAEHVAEIIHKAAGISESDAHHLVEQAPHDVVFGVTEDQAAKVVEELSAAGASAVMEPLKPHKWPVPYDDSVNPLSIDLTAFNTFILICSSVTMVLALSAIQRGDRTRFILFLAATAVIGSVFLSIQVYEYYQLTTGHHYPVGISATGHFRPSVSLFASCFFTMTGFHGAHVAGGVVMLTSILIASILGKFTPDNYSPVELVGLYWHFVDLVWIILFTVVYLI